MAAALLVGCASSDDSGGAEGVPEAPLIEMVMPMAPSGLHVTWKNMTTDCDAVEGERMTATAPWTVVFSVPGSVDNKHDGPITGLVEHTYRVRCQKGDHYSAYSNQKSGTPQ
jgi:hypothetical protein